MNNLSRIQDLLKMPAEHAVQFEGEAGVVEGRLVVPQSEILPYIALIGHPHSLKGGTMNNKVVTTIARTLQTLGIPSLRLNFRGVGESAGVFDQGIGESEDMLKAARCCQAAGPDFRFIFAGFSFGSYVAYRAASQYPHVLLMTVAPPVHHFDYMNDTPAPTPWHVIAARADEIVPAHMIDDFVEHMNLPVHWVDSGHFFHGKLLDLKSIITNIVLHDVFKTR